MARRDFEKRRRKAIVDDRGPLDRNRNSWAPTTSSDARAAVADFDGRGYRRPDERLVDIESVTPEAAANIAWTLLGMAFHECIPRLLTDGDLLGAEKHDAFLDRLRDLSEGEVNELRRLLDEAGDDARRTILKLLASFAHAPVERESLVNWARRTVQRVRDELPRGRR